MISINFFDFFSVTDFRVRSKLHKASRFGLSLNVSRPYLWLKGLKFYVEFEMFKVSQFSQG